MPQPKSPYSALETQSSQIKKKKKTFNNFKILGEKQTNMWLKCRSQGGRHPRLMEIKGPEVGGCLTCGNGVQGQDWVSRTAEGLGGSAQGLRGHGCGETAVVTKWRPTFCSPWISREERRRGLLPAQGLDHLPCPAGRVLSAGRGASLSQSDRNPHRGHCSGPLRNGPSVSHAVVKLKILKKSRTETFWAYTAQDLSLWAVLPAP